IATGVAVAGVAIAGGGTLSMAYMTMNPVTPPGSFYDFNNKLNNVLKNAWPGRDTKGSTTQWNKNGGFEQALEDFYEFQPTNVNDFAGGKSGVLPNGNKISVRQFSSYPSKPTLQIDYASSRKVIKIRYH
nr:hypothetical protein [Anaerolineaceae bacterium]